MTQNSEEMGKMKRIKMTILLAALTISIISAGPFFFDSSDKLPIEFMSSVQFGGGPDKVATDVSKLFSGISTTGKKTVFEEKSGEKPRVYVACMNHETNSFSPIPTSLESFTSTFYYDPENKSGTEYIKDIVGIGAIISSFEKLGYDISMGPVAFAGPSGPLNQKDYEHLRGEFLSSLKKADGRDVVCLFLHGAQIAEGYEDCEGDLVMHIRQFVGPEIPIGVLLDLHSDLSQQLIDNASIIISCKEYPHTDFNDRAEELVALLDKTRKVEIKPVMVRKHVPMLSFFHTTSEPMRSFVDDLFVLENGDLLSISLLHGFPWGDTRHAGANVLIVSDDAAKKSEELARQLAHKWFAFRANSRSKYLDIDTALDRALKQNQGLVVIADVADNPGGGAASDSTFILRSLLQRKIRNSAIASLWDPVALDFARKAGKGASLDLRIGGKISPFSGQPVDLYVTVKEIYKYPNLTGSDPQYFDVLVEAEGIHIVLSNLRSQVLSPDVFSRLGIDLKKMRILVVKSSQHFRAGFDPIASQVLYCDTPGSLNSDIKKLPYKNVPRPIWPLDDFSFDNL